MLTIDGSYGEGGGQILRTALSLSCVTGRPVEIFNIRANRKRPGLQPQHLTVVLACRDISNAEIHGAELNSRSLVFIPQEIKGGEYLLDVEKTAGKGSAGSVTLILQAVLPPLCLVKSPSRLILKGGTHVPWSPPFHYCNEILIPFLKRIGAMIELRLERWGFYPLGKGEASAYINPTHTFAPLHIKERGKLKKISGLSSVANLPISIAQRQKDALLNLLRKSGIEPPVEVIEAPSIGKGTFCFIKAEFENSMAGFASLGAIGKKAETVGEETANGFLDFMNSNAAVDLHLADQIVPYLAMAEGKSSFTVQRITRHLLTNIWVVQQFFKREIEVEGALGESGRITIV